MKRKEHTMQPLQQEQHNAKGNEHHQQFSVGLRFERTSYTGGKTCVFVVKQDWKTN